MTILIWFHCSGYRNFKTYYHEHVQQHLRSEFPTLVSYSRFVEFTPSALLPLLAYLRTCLGPCSGLSFLDATALAVCHPHRISQHKVFAGWAQRAKTSPGWFFGFKLHLLVNDRGELLNFALSPGNTDDRRPVPTLVKRLFGKIFADKGYVSQPLFQQLACAACIDACDEVMNHMRYPRGLIRYATQNSMENVRTRVLRPRTVIYGSLLLALIIGFGVAVAQRRLIEVDVLRDRNALFREAGPGLIENVYTVRFINKDTRPHTMHLEVRGLPGATLDSDRPTYTVGAGEIVSAAVRIRVPQGAVSGGRDIRIVARSVDEKPIDSEADARFIAPVSR